MITKCHNYDFTWISYEDPYWKDQQDVPQLHAMAMMAALFHYRMHAPDLMRFLGGTDRSPYRDFQCLFLSVIWLHFLKSFEKSVLPQFIPGLRMYTYQCRNRYELFPFMGIQG